MEGRDEVFTITTSLQKGVFNDTERVYAHVSSSNGMTVRDKLAESAMIGLLGNTGIIDTLTDSNISWIAEHSYKLADAMIEQSKK